MRFAVAGLVFTAIAVAQFENTPIGFIDFYGLDGLDSRKLRAALTVRPGDKFAWPETRDRMQTELAEATGRPFTHFVPVCCDTLGRLMIYVDFVKEAPAPAFGPKPAQDIQLP